MAVSRWIAAVCFVIAGALVVAFGHWWGVMFFVAAALNGSLAYLVPRWNLLRDAPKNVERVRELQRSRALVVDDAAARLRRIEQDLHDGAQAQMVAVVMKLGLARDHLSTPAARLEGADLDRALELVDAAHRGAMEAITELRDLAPGHPSTRPGRRPRRRPRGPRDTQRPAGRTGHRPARAPVPCDRDDRLLLRRGAAHERGEAQRRPAREAGGAPPAQPGGDASQRRRHRRRPVEPGGGLAGLAERVKTVDGRLRVESPAGGPTVVAVELPSQF